MGHQLQKVEKSSELSFLKAASAELYDPKTTDSGQETCVVKIPSSKMYFLYFALIHE